MEERIILIARIAACVAQRRWRDALAWHAQDWLSTISAHGRALKQTRRYTSGKGVTTIQRRVAAPIAGEWEEEHD